MATPGLLNCLDGDLPPNLHHLIHRQPEKVGRLKRVALHGREDKLPPFRKPSAIWTRDNRLPAYIVSHVIQIEVAAALLRFLKNRRDRLPAP